jgi:uncharacterized SAM-binding protein YcdF (DUF218 family)
MFFYVSKITSLFTEPVTLIFLILLASAFLRWMGHQRWAWCGIGIAIGLMTIVMVLPLDFWLLRPLEDRFPVPAPQACLDGIVMLGGGEDIQGSERRGMPLLAGAPMRYIVLSELMRRYAGARVIFAGGSGILGTHKLAEADVSRGIMEKIDLDLRRVVFESSSRTTWENAVNAKRLMQPKPGERWALLAPAEQLPRAVGAFRKIGWSVLPWPTDFSISAPVWWSPDLGGRFEAIDEGEHEWLGLIVYWITGRSSELLPGPLLDIPPKSAC